MQTPRISIAMATYQGARFLSEQLESFLAQTLLPNELCVSDDGSDDGTLDIVQKFAERAPFAVKVAANLAPAGAGSNFQNAAQQCTGDIILFSDQDDVWLAEHIERLVAPMQLDSRIVAVASNSMYVTQSLELTGVTLEQSERIPTGLRNATMRLPPNQFELVLRHRISAGHGMAFRTWILPLLTPFSDHWIYDQWVFILAAAAGFVTYEPRPLTLHRQHGQQHVKNRKRTLRSWATVSAAVPLSRQHSEVEKWRDLLTRLQDRRQLVRDYDSAERSLEEKLNFVTHREQIRSAPLASRIPLITSELIKGKYHRLGRGFITLARDLYGSRS
jgi:glycosyltransferase involved in cell wall biosynthesis